MIIVTIVEEDLPVVHSFIEKSGGGWWMVIATSNCCMIGFRHFLIVSNTKKSLVDAGRSFTALHRCHNVFPGKKFRERVIGR